MITETITTYGLLMVMQFANLEQCEAWATKLYDLDSGGCFEQYETIKTLIDLPPERPRMFLSNQYRLTGLVTVFLKIALSRHLTSPLSQEMSLATTNKKFIVTTPTITQRPIRLL